MIGGVFWYRQKATERVRAIARQHCQQQQLQLLDDTVSLKKTRITRSDAGRFCIQSVYQFEFSSLGDDRYSGELVYQCGKVISVRLDAHRFDSGID